MVQERRNKLLADQTLLNFFALSTVVGSMFAKKQEAAKNVKQFQKMLENLSDG